jgi:hypothetical protein
LATKAIATWKLPLPRIHSSDEGSLNGIGQSSAAAMARSSSFSVGAIDPSAVLHAVTACKIRRLTLGAAWFNSVKA